MCPLLNPWFKKAPVSPVQPIVVITVVKNQALGDITCDNCALASNVAHTNDETET